MNHVTQCTKNGKTRWRVDYIGSDRQRHFKFLPTKDEADDFLAQAITTSRQPTVSGLPTTTTLTAYAHGWLEQTAAYVKPRTVASYRDTLRLHLLPAFGKTRVRDLERAKVKAFLVSRLKTHKPNSVRIMHGTLRTLLNAAIDDGLIVANVTEKLGGKLQLVTKTKVRQETIKAMDRAQRDAFLATAARVAPWWAPMWEVQVLSGLRPGEVYALEEGDLDLSARAVHVLRTHATTRKAQKLQYGWTEMPTPFFYSQAGTHHFPTSVRNAFARVCKAAKLPPSRRTACATPSRACSSRPASTCTTGAACWGTPPSPRPSTPTDAGCLRTGRAPSTCSTRPPPGPVCDQFFDQWLGC